MSAGAVSSFPGANKGYGAFKFDGTIAAPFLVLTLLCLNIGYRSFGFERFDTYFSLHLTERHIFRVLAMPLAEFLPRLSAVLVRPTTPSVAEAKSANGKMASSSWSLMSRIWVLGRLAFAYVEVALNVKGDG